MYSHSNVCRPNVQTYRTIITITTSGQIIFDGRPHRRGVYWQHRSQLQQWRCDAVIDFFAAYNRFNRRENFVCDWGLNLMRSLSLSQQYTRWRWRNVSIPIYASCSDRRDVGQGNVNILQHLWSDRRSGASTERFLKLPIQFYLNNLTHLDQLTLHGTTSCPTTWRSYREHRLL